jgi:hypothetical protein
LELLLCQPGQCGSLDSVALADHALYARHGLSAGTADRPTGGRDVGGAAVFPIRSNRHTGAVITEQIFRVPGIGSLLISAIQSTDTPVVMAITFVYSMLVVLFHLIADITYCCRDPCITYGQRGRLWIPRARPRLSTPPPGPLPGRSKPIRREPCEAMCGGAPADIAWPWSAASPC